MKQASDKTTIISVCVAVLVLLGTMAAVFGQWVGGEPKTLGAQIEQELAKPVN
ncbi:hypothetical protein [Oceanicola sp. D3]|uniref:hypothetical protein n=1 Tax=Oceanicola sp. D3 TaxID=2587163 RepID=UPI00143E0A03|nr:hypothetical protein [Oceanicola sp. D3]